MSNNKNHNDSDKGTYVVIWIMFADVTFFLICISLFFIR